MNGLIALKAAVNIACVASVQDYLFLSSQLAYNLTPFERHFFAISCDKKPLLLSTDSEAL
jgi:hypothetical protein